MLSRVSKAAFFALASPFMRLNTMRYRAAGLPRAIRHLPKAHLGPGRDKYLPGWVNVDANMFSGRCDVWSDLRYALPFGAGSLQAVYSHHVVEHLPDLRSHFNDVFRSLGSNGVYRVAVPHADNAVRKFLAGDSGWFSNFPDNRRSIGGRLDNFLLCRNEHLAIISFSYLNELLSDAGFNVIGECIPSKTTNFAHLFGADVLGSEHESDFEFPHTLVVEAQKPGP